MLSLASLDIYIRQRQYMLEIYRYNTDNITIFINIVVKCKYTTVYHIGKTLIKRIHSLIQPAAKRKQKVFWFQCIEIRRCWFLLMLCFWLIYPCYLWILSLHPKNQLVCWIRARVTNCIFTCSLETWHPGNKKVRASVQPELFSTSDFVSYLAASRSVTFFSTKKILLKTYNISGPALLGKYTCPKHKMRQKCKTLKIWFPCVIHSVSGWHTYADTCCKNGTVVIDQVYLSFFVKKDHIALHIVQSTGPAKWLGQFINFIPLV